MIHLTQAKIITGFQEEALKAARLRHGLRRADRFTVMAVAAVAMAFPDGFPAFSNPDTGLVTCSSFGPHKTSFDTIDDILDYPEDQILPTRFSHSVHNAVTSYLGSVLKIKGPSFAVTNFENPVYEALNLADTLLSTGMCENLLLVAVEERGLLTVTAAKDFPKRFPQEPAEAAAVFLASGNPAETSFSVTLEPASGEHDAGNPFQLPSDFISHINSHQNTRLYR